MTEFSSLGLPDTILKAIKALGYETATPIQAQAIPAILEGRDVLGQAQTGTGKTAAFALPLLAQIQIKRREPQILVLVPTRELALQVAEAFNSFSVNIAGLNILPIYGGQGYSAQLNMLRKGVHIIIGTPGRVMDHMRRGTLTLDSLKTLVLDEADEMLRMGFAEDVEWILEHSPSKRQIALFSATMPNAIREIAEKHLNNPQKIKIKSETTTASTIKQYYWLVNNLNKLDALSRIFEAEPSDGVIVFVRTKRATEEVAQALVTRGFNAVAINGDIVQQQRERVIDQLREGKLKILVATDVAARGIDVERITHVINYDAPNNAETYVHRIGRTGRAGRSGTAIIFVSPREKYVLRDIEHLTKHPIELMEAPSVKTINERRVASFKQKINDVLGQDLSFYENLISEYMTETQVPAEKVAAALAKIMQGDSEFLLKKSQAIVTVKDDAKTFKGRERERAPRERSFKERSFKDRERPSRDRRDRDVGMEQYRIEIGKDHGLQPKNLVGAIANTAGIEGRLIGKIKIESKFSLVDLPKGMPKDILKTLQKLKVAGRLMNMQRV